MPHLSLRWVHACGCMWAAMKGRDTRLPLHVEGEMTAGQADARDAFCGSTGKGRMGLESPFGGTA